jgi:hypothetical protein
MFAGTVPACLGQVFEFPVRHEHLFKDCTGTLTIRDDGVQYQTDHTEDARSWGFRDIRTIEVRSRAEIAVVTYEDQKRLGGKDRSFEFVLLEGEADSALSGFLLDRVKKPLMVAVPPEGETPEFELAVKHLRFLGGSRGVLRIHPDRLVYEASDDREDSRVWRMSDIERIGRSGRFRLQVVGSEGGTYAFQLMEELPDAVYDYVWLRLHPSAYYP